MPTSVNARPSSARPRVLHAITHLALGGAERIALSLVRELRGEFEFAVFAVNGVGADAVGQSMRQELADLGIPLFNGWRLPLKWGGLAAAAFAADHTLRRFQPDLVHLHTEIPEATFALLPPPRRTGRHRGWLRTVHHAQFWHHWAPLGRWVDRRLASAAVAAVSHDAARGFATLRASSGAPGRSATVIYNGVAAPASPAPYAAAAERPLRIIFGGRLESEKGADLLPEIFRRVSPGRWPSGQLRICGQGAHEATLRTWATHPPANWQVEVTPAVADFRAEIARADLVIVPSRSEGLSLVAVEAQLLGRPVVATHAEGLREALPDRHPWCASPGDATSFAATLQQAIDQSATWPAAVATARSFAATRFDLVTMCDAYRRLYPTNPPGNLSP